MNEKLAIGFIVSILLTGCGGGGGDSVAAEGPWAGTWVISDALNPSESRMSSCSGTLAAFEGELVAPQPGDIVCEVDSVRVRQSGSAITIDPQTVTCSDSSVVSVSGSGSVTDATFDLQLLWSESGVLYERDYYDGTRSGDIVQANLWGIEVSGGSCLVTPDLRYQAVIQR